MKTKHFLAYLLAWHDSGWNGKVCRHPEENHRFCAHLNSFIEEHKEICLILRGKPIHSFDPQKAREVIKGMKELNFHVSPSVLYIDRDWEFGSFGRFHRPAFLPGRVIIENALRFQPVPPCDYGICAFKEDKTPLSFKERPLDDRLLFFMKDYEFRLTEKLISLERELRAGKANIFVLAWTHVAPFFTEKAPVIQGIIKLKEMTFRQNFWGFKGEWAARFPLAELAALDLEGKLDEGIISFLLEEAELTTRYSLKGPVAFLSQEKGESLARGLTKSFKDLSKRFPKVKTLLPNFQEKLELLEEAFGT